MAPAERIPVFLDDEEIAARLRHAQGRAGLAGLGEVAALMRGILDPRGAYRTVGVGVGGERTVEAGGVSFESRILRLKLEKADRVFPYIITIGEGLEKAAASETDLLRQYYLEEMANIALEKAADWLSARIAERHGLGPLSSLSPGSLEDWPITEQPKLFSLFGDTEKLVGVRLTDSMLMIPRKSISGILFPSEEGFSACQLCEREKCPGRKAPYQRSAFG